MNNIFEYRSSLKDKDMSLYLLLGIVAEMILSKNFFKKNKDISDFLKNIFEIEFKDYIMKSRTVIMSKVLKHVYFSNNKEIQEYRKNLLRYIEENFYKEKPKQKSTNTLSKWIVKDKK